MRIRGFEAVAGAPGNTILPKRGTKHSAGYDFYAAENIVCRAHSISELSFTNVKAYMPKNEYLAIMIRSSLAIKHGLQVVQGTSIIDSDYYSNFDNDGNIGIAIANNSNVDYTIQKGERFCQGVFMEYKLADNDNTEGTRLGGYGSTGNV